MDTQVNADDVLQMAARIEGFAAQFYLKLAKSAASPVTREVMAQLAAMEQDHEKVVVGLREMAASGPAASLQDARAYAGVVALMTVDVEHDLEDRFEGNEPVEEIIRKAIDFEKATIVFLTGMKEMLTAPAQRQCVDTLIREELGHIFKLSGYLTRPAAGSPPARGGIGGRPHGQAESH